jgi:DNA repair ATPase RecN
MISLKELTKAGGEINKIQSQIKNLMRPMDDFDSAISSLSDISRKVSVPFTDVLGTYKELLNVSQDMNISQNQLLTSTENIFKATRIDKSSKEEIEQLFSTVNRIFASGTARPMTIGRIERLSPTVYKNLQAYYESIGKGTNLRELAKNKQIKSEDFVKALGMIDT